MLNDLDRHYQFEFNNSQPIAYALKGPSMTVDVLRKMTDSVIKVCEENGMQIVVTASDGQWHNYGIRDVTGYPLTCHQLHRDHWREVRSKDKAPLISTIKNMYKITSTKDIVIDCITEQYLPLYGCMQDESLMPRTWNKIVVHGHAKEKPIRLRKWSENDNRPEEDLSDDANVVKNSNMNTGCLDGDFQNDVDDDTLARIDEVYTGVQIGGTFDMINESSQEMFIGNTQDVIQLSTLFESADENINGGYVSEISSNNSTHNNEAEHTLSSTLSDAYETLYGSLYDFDENGWNYFDRVNETGNIRPLLVATQSNSLSHHKITKDSFIGENCSENIDSIDTNGLQFCAITSHSINENCIFKDDKNGTEVEVGMCDVELQDRTTEQSYDRYRDDAANQDKMVERTERNSINYDALLTIHDYQAMHTCLCEDEKAMRIHNWTTVSLEEFSIYFLTKESLKRHFQKYELSCCLASISDILNSRHIKFHAKWQKYRMMDFFIELCSPEVSHVNNSNVMTHDTNSKSKRFHAQSLRKMCLNFVTKLSKTALATIIAEHAWEKSFQVWKDRAPIPSSIDIKDVQDNIQWFTQPSIGPDNKLRFHFTDACHILTCIRTKLCTTGIAGLRRKAWEEAALSSNTHLNISVVVECVDKQDVSLARRMFGNDVEMTMGENYRPEASFCGLIRRWFDSEDEPSIPAIDRCRHRLGLRNWLLKGYEIGRFPPVTQYVRWIPIITYEALVSHTERKMQLHAFVPGGKYNVRATGSQEVEQFFSTFRDMDPSGKGTPKPDVIPEMMTSVAEIDKYRLNPKGPFLMRTSRAAVYPSTKMSVNEDSFYDDLEDQTLIRDPMIAKTLQCIIPRNHFFDNPERNTKKHKRKSGKISKPEESAHGEMGVRQFHARDDSKILTHLRKGMLDIPDINDI